MAMVNKHKHLTLEERKIIEVVSSKVLLNLLSLKFLAKINHTVYNDGTKGQGITLRIEVLYY